MSYQTPSSGYPQPPQAQIVLNQPGGTGSTNRLFATNHNSGLNQQDAFNLVDPNSGRSYAIMNGGDDEDSGDFMRIDTFDPVNSGMGNGMDQ
jgi:hypothetical protein